MSAHSSSLFEQLVFVMIPSDAQIWSEISQRGGTLTEKLAEDVDYVVVVDQYSVNDLTEDHNITDIANMEIKVANQRFIEDCIQHNRILNWKRFEYCVSGFLTALYSESPSSQERAYLTSVLDLKQYGVVLRAGLEQPGYNKMEYFGEYFQVALVGSSFEENQIAINDINGTQLCIIKQNLSSLLIPYLINGSLFIEARGQAELPNSIPPMEEKANSLILFVYGPARESLAKDVLENMSSDGLIGWLECS